MHPLQQSISLIVILSLVKCGSISVSCYSSNALLKANICRKINDVQWNSFLSNLSICTWTSQRGSSPLVILLGDWLVWPPTVFQMQMPFFSRPGEFCSRHPGSFQEKRKGDREIILTGPLYLSIKVTKKWISPFKVEREWWDENWIGVHEVGKKFIREESEFSSILQFIKRVRNLILGKICMGKSLICLE